MINIRHAEAVASELEPVLVALCEEPDDVFSRIARDTTRHAGRGDSILLLCGAIHLPLDRGKRAVIRLMQSPG
jgi:hypothetical protein